MNKKMKLAIFVHDLHMELGHSRALIEQIGNIPSILIEEIKIFTYTCSAPEKIFPQHKGKVTVISSPVKNLYPFLLKTWFYHGWVWWRLKRNELDGFIKIGIGVASLKVDVVNIQFVQCQWEEAFFKLFKMNLLVKAYKKIMYFYFRKCEEYLYTQKNVKIYVLSQFVYDYMRSRFNISQDRLALIYSGINLDQFQLLPIERKEIFSILTSEYPQLNLLNPSRPTYLFVGAYERKGLATVLEYLGHLEEYQLIVVGEKDSTGSIIFSENPKHITVRIKYTNRIADFYAISDSFFFPTMYEPFGLVILEAAAMGLQIITRRQEVGASELLVGLPEVYFIDDKDSRMPTIRYLNRQDKEKIRCERLARFQSYTWLKSSEQLLKFLKNI
ncbi:MAG: hypothetical protein A2381_05195 [Bdellovibrionales bacterium RIFOXYB1_FULL_37_110]|nr:MAG: hypothetical protein A2417_16675 [Bdellovibrionales bacterium RIFOXYC1_FULL_37_79]OFZ58141.1 MAG: hypothetical protein A2381_05195 [Bdellovibrionales bacterium RIFOXYB1_FULL_37_110]OFZ61830.1 MAG: hypothetical protein A2577_18780 [Bdellovibrionales bacterium RIFOXYD1_FULL_36_51]